MSNLKVITYPWALEAYNAGIHNAWNKDRFPMAGDITDWAKLPERDRAIMAGILRGFAVIEQSIGAHWRTLPEKINTELGYVSPELVAACAAFSNHEWIHAYAYDHLESSLGLDTYDAFMEDWTCQSKMDVFKNNIGLPIPRAVTLYSCFGEGVSLYGSFAVLLDICRKGVLASTSQILSYSVRDELLHYQFAVKMAQEFGWIPEEDTCTEWAELVVENELNFLASCDALTEPIRGFIHHRANTVMEDLGFGPIFKVGDNSVADWFYPLAEGTTLNDFFAHSKNGSAYRETAQPYSNVNFDEL